MSIRLDKLDPNDPQRIALGVRRQSTVSIPSALLLALFATPKIIVPKPGAGRFIVFDGAELYLRYGTVAYTLGTASGLGVKYTGAAGLQIGQAALVGFLDQTANQRRYVNAYNAASGASEFAPVVNAPLVLQSLTAAPTLGNSTLLVRTYYFIQEALR